MRRMVMLTGLLLGCSSLALGDWPQWRGPHYNGSGEATNLPVEFSKEKNFGWSLAMPGPAASTPIVVGDRIYLTSTGPDNALLAMALDLATGRELWSHTLTSARAKDRRSTMANPSPVYDGNQVIFFVSTGDLAGFTLDGQKRWQRNIVTDYGEFAFLWTFSASPTLHEGKLLLPVLQRNEPARGNGRPGAESFLLVMDPDTGKTLHRVIRPTRAQGESMESYSTVIPATFEGKAALVLAGADAVTTHHPQTGEELWRWETYNTRNNRAYRLVSSPVVADGLIIVCTPRGHATYALKPGSDEPVWVNTDRESGSDVATPLYYQDRLYVLNGERQILAALDAKTGRMQWNTPVRGNILRASPTGADGKIYMMNHDADVFVVDATSGELLATNRLRDESREAQSTIVAAGNRLLVRTDNNLYCFVQQADE